MTASARQAKERGGDARFPEFPPLSREAVLHRFASRCALRRSSPSRKHKQISPRPPFRLVPPPSLLLALCLSPVPKHPFPLFCRPTAFALWRACRVELLGITAFDHHPLATLPVPHLCSILSLRSHSSVRHYIVRTSPRPSDVSAQKERQGSEIVSPTSRYFNDPHAKAASRSRHRIALHHHHHLNHVYDFIPSPATLHRAGSA